MSARVTPGSWARDLLLRPRWTPALALIAFAVWLVPAAAEACPTCISTAFGDRTYNWAFLGLLALPFAVVGVVGGAIVYHLRAARRADLSPPAAPPRDPAFIEEST